MLAALIPLLGSLMDKLFPDPAAAADAKLKVMALAQSGELAQLDADLKMATGQMETNKVEAASSSLFVAGWRPFIGWTCGAAFAFKFILAPLLAFGFAAAGHPVALPVLDFTEMSTILMGMLGLGGLRTVEKIKGVA
ncbi:MAG: 3TM-type holin [Pseudomonadota bacterium]